ncbi:MAG TPA: FtsW/RodA/SpoVE family cell cycle protein [Bacillales bacterium]|nr:FtsW/RodA/SpoVE family cell cycle protein [Bacillales bacterium]
MIKKMFQHFDYTMVIPVLLLGAFGVLMVYSSGIYWADWLGFAPDHFFVQQSMNFAAALVAFAFAMLFPYKAYAKFMKPILGISLLLLVFVKLNGTVSGNAQSWINVAGVNFQPSEFAKIGVIIYLAAVFSKKQHYITNFSRGVVPPLIVILITFLLIAAQPDLGTAMIIAGISGVMIVCSGMRIKHLTALLGLAVIGISVMLLFGSILSLEQLSRFDAAYHPFEHSEDDAGYQMINSYLAIAAGGLTGRGLGDGIQKYGFLPESYTDFIMAIIAEEFGLIGVTLVIGTLCFLVFKGFIIGIRCKDTFGSLLAVGIAGMIGVQSVINLGVVCGLLPVTGIPLPFVSYGGSSLVVCMFAMGVLINISMFIRWKKDESNGHEQPEPHSVFQQGEGAYRTTHR